jgi:FAD/FMN-containing dehydrogenase
VKSWHETGTAGMTLGGGSGGRMRQYRLAGDHLVAADVVAAEGAVITANGINEMDPPLYGSTVIGQNGERGSPTIQL